MMTIFDFEKPINELESAIAELRQLATEKGLDRSREIAELEAQRERLLRQIFAHLRPWDKVLLARHPKRPYALDYIRLMCESFIELHGDRLGFDDPAVVAGLAKMGGRNLVIVGQQKGRDLKERQRRNFAMAKPEGYRKALRLMKLAEKYSLPVITFIDTSGAFPGLDGEERGVAEAIARNLTEMARVEVPIIALVTGEGGSGGALGIGVADIVLMMQYAYYSVISPEGCAGILWRDGAKAPLAAQALKLTARDLLKYKVIDEIVPEPTGGAHKDYEQTAASIKESLTNHLKALSKLPVARLHQKRFEKFSAMGIFAKE